MTLAELSALRPPELRSALPYLVEVCLHELKDDKNVLELSRVRRQQDVLDLHDVRVLQLAQQLDLAKYARGVLQHSSGKP